VTATPTSTLSPGPNNTCGGDAEGQNLGSLPTGATAQATGVNVGSSALWWTIDFPNSGWTLSLSSGGGTPAGSDIMNIYSDCSGTAVSSGSTDVTSYTGTYNGTVYVQVEEGSSGSDGYFTLSADG
jgi:hypothetical protein